MSTPLDYFTQAYQSGDAPWEIGHPQRAIVEALDGLDNVTDAIDMGCGTGTHVLHLASRGIDAYGLDMVALAIEQGRQAAAAAGLRTRFITGDVFAPPDIGPFSLILDCGLMHLFKPGDQRRYIHGLHTLSRQDTRLLILGYSGMTAPQGPPGYHPDEVGRLLGPCWQLDMVRRAKFEGVSARGDHPAWLSLFTRRDQ